MKQFISVNDTTDINRLVQNAITYRNNPFCDAQLGSQKRIGMIFLNPSLRTRLSTQLAAQNLGMEAIVLNADKDSWKMEFEDEAIMSGQTVEHVRDAAPILGKYFDILAIRIFPGLINREEDYSEQVMNQFIRFSGVPVVSLESATLHPLQSLADIITIKDNFTEKRKPKVVLTWAPHIKPLPQCVANSFSQWVNAWGEAELVITHPPDYELDKAFTQNAYITHNQQEALQDADFVYAKNWSTYNDYGRIYSNDPSWMLQPESLKKTNNAKVMHCLPVRRNVELSDEVLDSSASLVTQQATNRVWAAQAVLAEILKNK